MDGRGEDSELEVYELLGARVFQFLFPVFHVVSPRGREVPAEILDGKALGEKTRRQVAIDTASFVAQAGVVPGLTVVLVGEDPASQVYVRNKAAACKAAGMNGRVLRLPADTSQVELLSTIERLNGDPDVHGILVQLPVPGQIDESIVVEAVSPQKDVDGFHPANFGLLAAGTPRFVPCTPLGIRELLLEAKIETRGAHAVVLGRSRIVGRPLAFLLLQKGPGGDSTVTLCHTATRDAAHLARQADLLFVAMGQPELVTADWIKPGAVVIDVGIHKRADGRLCGDVHFESVSRVASHITPVPGGVGPMTIAMLLKNTLKAARMSVAAGSS
jgi:methylenetetrahydrofolate dehydrogenase (NADP+) / methenyltetrahydrofolate cyclohydrolase